MKGRGVVSRRTVLQSMAAILAVSGLPGCSSSSSDDDDIVSNQTNLSYDDELKTCFSSGPYNCGAKCLHKIHYKNGRIIHLTSAGDIPRAGSYERDNSPGKIGMPIQRRACVRGYSYLQRLYQPDRLKYPMIQMGQKGDVNGFVRVDWDTAITKAAGAIHSAIQRRSTLGYSPIMCKWAAGIDTFSTLVDSPSVAPCITHLGNESTGACDAAKFDMVGPDAFTNNVSDRLNSNFIITWGLDPSRTTYYVEHAHWFNTVCKEQGTQIVAIVSNHSDTAAMLTTGVKNYTYTVNGISKTIDIPNWIPVRPATDGALAAAMAYVIYKNGLHLPNTQLLQDQCFGFFKGQTITSTAPGTPFLSTKNLISPVDFVDDATTPQNFEKGKAYTGATFTVPDGESFEEYLISLENDWGGASGNAVGATTAAAGDATYYKVLRYASSLTGAPIDVIEALAFKYATTVPSFLDVGGGPQRAWNGVEWVQMMIALCTMTGNITRAGGGAGYAMMSQMDLGGTRVPAVAPSMMLSNAETMNQIYVPMNEWSHVALTGKDHRSTQRFIDDVKITTQTRAEGPLDLTGRSKPVEIDVWFMNNYNGLTTIENINKTVKAIKSIKTVICCDQTMTPTAVYSDIILPVCSHYETEGIILGTGSTALFKKDAPISKMYDTKTDNEIKNMILTKLNEMGHNFTTLYTDDSNPAMNAAVAAGTYEAMKGPSALYKALVDPDATAKTYEEFCNTGVSDWPIPKGKSLPAFQTFNIPGTLQNTTGRINFWQPFWGKLRQKTAKLNDPWGLTHEGFRNPTAKYQPNIEGYEKFFRNNDPTDQFTGFKAPSAPNGSGRTYKLLYMTNKSRNRAHTVFDNVAMIKDQFKQQVYINPSDAAVRGISNGDMVYVFNERGCTYIPACVTHYMVPGVVSVEHGAWYRPHPTATVKVWLDTEIDASGDPVFRQATVPVDVGGAENVLTLSIGTSEQYVGQAISAQGGPCEVSLTHPDELI